MEGINTAILVLTACTALLLGCGVGYFFGKWNGHWNGSIEAEAKYKPFRDPVAVIREEESGCFSTRIGEEDGDGINVLYEAREKDMPWDRKLAVSRVLTIMPSARIVHECSPAPQDEVQSKRPPMDFRTVRTVRTCCLPSGQDHGRDHRIPHAGTRRATRRRQDAGDRSSMGRSRVWRRYARCHGHQRIHTTGSGGRMTLEKRLQQSIREIVLLSIGELLARSESEVCALVAKEVSLMQHDGQVTWPTHFDGPVRLTEKGKKALVQIDYE